jgi:hypothetical protein
MVRFYEENFKDDNKNYYAPDLNLKHDANIRAVLWARSATLQIPLFQKQWYNGAPMISSGLSNSANDYGTTPCKDSA